jgi:hypothetical protein
MSPDKEFDVRALYDAIDARRAARGLCWKDVAVEVSERCTRLRPSALSTITGLKEQPHGEGDGILQMLVWLRRTPESFISGVADPRSACFVNPTLASGEILRWDTRALHAGIDARRRERESTWAETARELRGFTPGMLTTLAKRGRIGFPRVMRLVLWLGEPAATFTRVDAW